MTTRPEDFCTLLQEIGLPAVRVDAVSTEVVEFNGLFSSLIDGSQLSPIELRYESMWHSIRLMDGS